MKTWCQAFRQEGVAYHGEAERGAYGKISFDTIANQGLPYNQLKASFINIMKRGGPANGNMAAFMTYSVDKDETNQCWVSFYDYDDSKLPLTQARFGIIMFEQTPNSGNLERAMHFIPDLVESVYQAAFEGISDPPKLLLNNVDIADRRVKSKVCKTCVGPLFHGPSVHFMIRFNFENENRIARGWPPLTLDEDESEPLVMEYGTFTIPLFSPEALGLMRNDPCFCGSGKKFRKCCRKRFM